MKKLTKKEKRNILAFLVFLVVAFLLVVLIGANIPYTPAELGTDPGSLQKFVEWSVLAKGWIYEWYIVLVFVLAGLLIVFKLKK